jgi:hypothetical protein
MVTSSDHVLDFSAGATANRVPDLKVVFFSAIKTDSAFFKPLEQRCSHESASERPSNL